MYALFVFKNTCICVCVHIYALCIFVLCMYVCIRLNILGEAADTSSDILEYSDSLPLAWAAIRLPSHRRLPARRLSAAIASLGKKFHRCCNCMYVCMYLSIYGMCIVFAYCMSIRGNLPWWTKGPECSPVAANGRTWTLFFVCMYVYMYVTVSYILEDL